MAVHGRHKQTINCIYLHLCTQEEEKQEQARKRKREEEEDKRKQQEEEVNFTLGSQKAQGGELTHTNNRNKIRRGDNKKRRD